MCYKCPSKLYDVECPYSNNMSGIKFMPPPAPGWYVNDGTCTHCQDSGHLCQCMFISKCRLNNSMCKAF